MCTVETARRTLWAVGGSGILFLIIIGSAEADPGALGTQVIILVIGAIFFAGLFFGLVYFFSHHCHLVTASELIAGEYYAKRQKIIRNARRAPNPLDRNWIMRKIQREIRLAFLKKVQGKKLQRRW